MRLFKLFRIDRLLFGVYGGFMIALLLIVTWIGYSYSSKALVDNTSHYQEKLLNELNKQLVLLMESVENVSLTVARNPDVELFLSPDSDDYDRFVARQDLLKYMSQITFSTPVIFSIDWFGNDSSLIVSTDEVTAARYSGRRAMDEDWYVEQEDADFGWIGEHSYAMRGESRTVISFSRKIYTDNRQFGGVLKMNILASSFQDIMLGSGGDAGANRMLTDTLGRIITGVGGIAEMSAVRSFLGRMTGRPVICGCARRRRNPRRTAMI